MVLTTLATRDEWSAGDAKIEIFLHEGMLDEAIAVVDNFRYCDGRIMHLVMEATAAHRPDWTIENACRRAKYIIDEKKAKYYHEAVGWLKKAKAAYMASGRTQEWSTYLSELRKKHPRQYKLMGLLNELNG